MVTWRTAVNAAAIATTKAASDDAELLALGPELEQVAAEWVAQYAISNKDLADFNAEVYAATGITRADQPRYSEESSYWKTLLAISAERSRTRPADAFDEHGCCVVWNRIHDRMWPLVEDILERKASTVQGLAIQATAVTLANSELWDDAFEGDDHLRCFIENACSFLGVVPVPLRVVE